MLTLLKKAACLVTHTDVVSVHAGCLLVIYGCVFVRIVFVLYVSSYNLGQNYPLGTFEDVLNEFFFLNHPKCFLLNKILVCLNQLLIIFL